MRHRVAHRKLGRVTEHRIALLRNQAHALIKYERIETTVPRSEVIDELFAAVKFDKRAIHDGAWARATTEVCLAILESSRTGGEQTLQHQVAPAAS